LRIKSIKVSFDARKLEKSLKKTIINKTIEDFAEIVKDETIDGLKSGKDVRGNPFKKIRPVTKKIRRLRGSTSTKPLVDSGEMLKSIKVVDGTSQVGKYKQKDLIADSYGNSKNKNVHQQGFNLEKDSQKYPNIEGEWFDFRKVGRIAARPWFHNQETIEKSQKINSSFQDLAKEYFTRFNNAFTKKIGR